MVVSFLWRSYIGRLSYCFGPLARASQPQVEARPDVLVYTSPPLEGDLDVIGPLQVIRWASSSAKDTDFTAKLVDVTPEGLAMNLADDIIRARYRQSLSKPLLLEPGKVCNYTINLDGVSNLFKKGHRIRVEISSSNFPALTAT